jgi:hypothetical protein
MDDRNSKLNRRDLFRMIGLVAGESVMYQAMTGLGYAADSQYAGPIKLQGAPRGAKVIVLGAGMAGLVSALELRNAGYDAQVLQFNDRVGGRAWSLRAACQVCHMPVLHGSKAMPAFNAALGDAQVAAVVSYVRTHFGNVHRDKVSADQVNGLRSMAH